MKFMGISLDLAFSLGHIFGTAINLGILIGLHLLKWYIYKKKESEHKLLMSQFKINNMLANISDVVAIIDKNAIFTYKSPNIEKIFGWKPEELIGKPGWTIVHPDDLHRVQSTFLLMLKNKNQTTEIEFRYKTKSGDYKKVNLKAKSMLSETSLNGILLNYHDISEKENAEKARLASENKYRILFETISDVVCILDINKNILEINQPGCDLFEYHRNDILGMSITSFVHPEDIDYSSKFMDQLDKQGSYKMYEGRIITKSGKLKWIQVNSSVFEIKNKKIGSLDIIREITEKKKAESDLKALNATKDKFFSIISHDLRNPFSTIIGFSELIKEKLKHNEYDRIDEMVSLVNETALQGDKLLSNLLEWSNSQSGKQIFSPKLHNLFDIIKPILDLYKNTSAQKGISLINKIPPDYSVFADTNMLQTIIRNLISNALKFTPSGGSVTLSATVTNNHNVITICDTGVGINEVDLANIFKIGHQFSTSGTNNEKGTGLGLLLCKEFTERHKGELTVTSDLKKGSCFNIIFPTKS